VCAITDEDNLRPPAWLAPILVGLTVIAIGISFGALHGYAINPARDLGPRLFITLAGFRNNGLTDGTFQFVVPLIAPLIGGLAGTAAWEFLIRRYLPEAD